jgi:hypothetical protein
MPQLWIRRNPFKGSEPLPSSKTEFWMEIELETLFRGLGYSAVLEIV